MPIHVLVLAWGDQRERVDYDSGVEPLTIGDEIEFHGRCWRLVDRQLFPPEQAPDHVTFLCAPCPPTLVFHAGGRYEAAIYRRELMDLVVFLRRSRSPPAISLRSKLSAILQNRGAAAETLKITDHETRELSWAIEGLAGIEGHEVTPSLDALRIQVLRYLDDLRQT